jgi:hypothetical protein
MRRIVAISAFVSVFLFGLAVRADQPEPRAIIDRAIQAAGGEEALNKNKAQTWNETGTFYGMGDGIPYKGAYASQPPDKFKMEIQNVFTIVVNGDKASFGGGDASPEQLSELKEDNYVRWISGLLPLKDQAFKLSAIGEAKVGDQPAVGVQVSHQGHRDVKLYFNKDNGLLVKVVARVKAEELGGKEVDQEIQRSNFKEMSGIKVPTKVAIQRDGKKFVEAEISDWKGTEKLDDNIFKP